MADPAMLEVSNLRIAFPVAGRMAEAVHGISFRINSGEAVGMLGESGSGKSATALAVMGLLARPARVSADAISFLGRDIRHLAPRERRAISGKDISIVFQDPQTAMTPSIRVGRQLMHVLLAHEDTSRARARDRVMEMLRLVGLNDPARVFASHPHELSGGMRQRALIGMALLGRPKLLIADEPTTALDVTVQAEIIKLLVRLRRELGLTVMFISHNLDIMAELCDRAVVMYGGHIVEEGDAARLLRDPRHPYTRMLIDCIPRLHALRGRLTVIRGAPPPIGGTTDRCAFQPRCPVATDSCSRIYPPELRFGADRVFCWEAAQ